MLREVLNRFARWEANHQPELPEFKWDIIQSVSAIVGVGSFLSIASLLNFSEIIPIVLLRDILMTAFLIFIGVVFWRLVERWKFHV